jgi:phosphoribosylanthranilate isomerase
MPKVKICGMQCAEDIDMAVRFGADAVGFITDVPVQTSRKIDSDTASGLIRHVPLFVESVLVIMPYNTDHALELVRKTHPDSIQLHNDMGPEDIEIIRDGINGRQKIIKTFTVSAGAREVMTAGLIAQIDALSETGLIDGALLDSGKTGMIGGTGITHDWSVSREIVENTDIPIILAGGLKPENVRDAVEQVRPFAVDTASGVETEGNKDPAKVCRFIREARCING